jgi:hypothetical protein
VELPAVETPAAKIGRVLDRLTYSRWTVGPSLHYAVVVASLEGLDMGLGGQASESHRHHARIVRLQVR